MKPSPLKHTLAILRHAIGPDMTQKEMARLVKRSPVTIQKIELLKLPLAESLGLEIAYRTGVKVDWLMKNDINAPIVDSDLQPYTRETFERRQAVNPNDPQLLFNAYFHVPTILTMCVMNVARGALAAQAAKQVGAVELFGYRITKAVGDVIEPMAGFEELFEKWADRLQKALRSDDQGNECFKLVNDILRDCGNASNKIVEAKIGRPIIPPRNALGSRQTGPPSPQTAPALIRNKGTRNLKPRYSVPRCRTPILVLALLNRRSTIPPQVRHPKLQIEKYYTYEPYKQGSYRGRNRFPRIGISITRHRRSPNLSQVPRRHPLLAKRRGRNLHRPVPPNPHYQYTLDHPGGLASRRRGYQHDLLRPQQPSDMLHRRHQQHHRRRQRIPSAPQFRFTGPGLRANGQAR